LCHHGGRRAADHRTQPGRWPVDPALMAARRACRCAWRMAYGRKAGVAGARVPGGKMQTDIDEIADGIYRLSTYVADVGPDGFTFNQFLISADEPLLFHTGPRR